MTDNTDKDSDGAQQQNEYRVQIWATTDISSISARQLSSGEVEA